MKTKYCLAYVAALYTLLTFVDISASADEIITQQKVFNKLDTSLSPALNEQGVFTLDSEILSLKTLSEHDKATAQVKLLALQASGLLLNQAEQYLLYIVHANIANVEGQENKVINWLNKAIKLEPSLAKKQLDTPLFAGAYLTLASIYERQRATQKAFDSKKIYIEKYFSYLEQQKELRVKRLDEKYDIERKHEKNQLLTQNNQLKRYALALAQSAQREQYRNIAIFLAASIIFFVLLLRQFKIRRALKSLAKTDSLTLLANRRAFFDNCHVAALASETMRSRDFLARIGGEEFAAILPDANIEQARAIAERIREKIQDHSNEHRVNDIQTTVSIGLASINDVRESFDSLLHAADMAMYQAKANGRNQVCSYISESKKK